MGFDMTLSLNSDGHRALAGMFLLQSGTTAMDVFSALNSSPWTAESFGGDPAKADACMYYVRHSLAWTAAYTFGAAILAQNAWPIIGWAIASAYMYWLYTRALTRGAASGSTGWSSPGYQQQQGGGY